MVLSPNTRRIKPLVCGRRGRFSFIRQGCAPRPPTSARPDLPAALPPHRGGGTWRDAPVPDLLFFSYFCFFCYFLLFCCFCSFRYFCQPQKGRAKKLSRSTSIQPAWSHGCRGVQLQPCRDVTQSSVWLGFLVLFFFLKSVEYYLL